MVDPDYCLDLNVCKFTKSTISQIDLASNHHNFKNALRDISSLCVSDCLVAKISKLQLLSAVKRYLFSDF